MRSPMMPKRWLGVGLAGIGLLCSGVTSAATKYVGDQPSINLRHGAGDAYPIEKRLEVGDKLETLAAPSRGWTRVRTGSGQTGYVLSRLLSDTPVARDQNSRLRQRISELQQNNADLQQRLSTLLNGSSKPDEVRQDLVAQNSRLKSRLQDIRETSADAMRISKENEKYRRQLMTLRSDVDRLKHENNALQSRRDGMKIGALILFGGILLGLVLPVFRRRRRDNWDSL